LDLGRAPRPEAQPAPHDRPLRERLAAAIEPLHRVEEVERLLARVEEVEPEDSRTLTLVTRAQHRCEVPLDLGISGHVVCARGLDDAAGRGLETLLRRATAGEARGEER